MCVQVKRERETFKKRDKRKETKRDGTRKKDEQEMKRCVEKS